MTDFDEVRVLAPTGVCGSGFLESSFERALALKPHFIGCDAGSTDPGPSYLGSGHATFPRHSVRRDLRLMLLGARRIGVPLIVGSAGTAGGEPHLQWVLGILKEIAEEERLAFKLAVIHSEQDKSYLHKRMREGRILPLDPAPEFDAATIDRSERIVGMMGPEPFIASLEGGADVIVAGRSSDTAIFAAMPLTRGIPPGIAWHAAKILECGAAAAVSRRQPDCIFAWLRQDHFVIEPMDPELRCTPQSVASHALYENANPFRLVESSGTLNLENATYEAISPVAVKVAGSSFEEAETYTVKLEGAEKVGYQSVLIGSVRDPYIIRQIGDWLDRLREKIAGRVADVYGGQVGPDDYTLHIRVYGLNGTMGALEPVTTPAHELCLVFEATAPTQDIATGIIAMTRHQALHLPIPEWSGLITAIAAPYSYLERGIVYRFNVNHVVVPDTPTEMFPIEFVNIGARGSRSAAA